MARPPVSAEALALAQLGVEGLAGLTDVVEAMHGTIARWRLPLGGAPEARTRGVTRLVYQGIRGVTRLVGGGLARVTPAPGADAVAASPRRAALISALNGVLGDRLAAAGSPLAIPLRITPVREPGGPAAPEAAAAAPRPGRLLVLVHGLCMHPARWAWRGHHHGEALARALGYTPLVVTYNSGRRIATNGRELAAALEALVATWPVPVEDIVLLGHSMGGLVARSACHHAEQAGHRWRAHLDALVCLGSPHHGAPLERAGGVVEALLGLSPYAAPIAKVAGVRAAGITDLRHGAVLDEAGGPARTPAPLPAGVRCFAIAGTTARRPGGLADRLVGDGLVPVASALGQHADPAQHLAFPAGHTRVIAGCGHMDLLHAPAVVDQLIAWLPRVL